MFYHVEIPNHHPLLLLPVHPAKFRLAINALLKQRIVSRLFAFIRKPLTVQRQRHPIAKIGGRAGWLKDMHQQIFGG